MVKTKIAFTLLLVFMLLSVLSFCVAAKNPKYVRPVSKYDGVHTVPEEFKNGPFTIIYDSPRGVYINIYDQPPEKISGAVPEGCPDIPYIFTKPHGDPHIMHSAFMEGYDEHDLYIEPGARPIGIFKGGVEYERGPDGHVREKHVKSLN